MTPLHFRSVLIFAAVSLFVANRALPQAGKSGGHASDRARTVLTASLPPDMDGHRLRATLITVHYGPGEASTPHTHACPVLVYVLEGKLRSEVKGQQETVYKTGDSFYESPGGLHLISANASGSAPAQFLAFFVCDRDVPLSSDPPPTSFGEKP